MGGGSGFLGLGGGGSATPSYEVQKAPTMQTTKNVTEAAAAARDAQKQRAAKAGGLKSTLLSDALLSGTQNTGSTAKTLLGR